MTHHIMAFAILVLVFLGVIVLDGYLGFSQYLESV
jgi:hypothetical protein